MNPGSDTVNKDTSVVWWVENFWFRHLLFTSCASRNKTRLHHSLSPQCPVTWRLSFLTANHRKQHFQYRLYSCECLKRAELWGRAGSVSGLPMYVPLFKGSGSLFVVSKNWHCSKYRFFFLDSRHFYLKFHLVNKNKSFIGLAALNDQD